MEKISTDVLVVGGGTGATAAAIQAARRGAKTAIVGETPWLGGMLTSAGVCAPDGNELAALQTGLWGAFVRSLRQRQHGGLDHAWVSFFTYEPSVGAAIFADWARALPNLTWLQDSAPRSATRAGDRLTAVTFEHYHIEAKIIIDGTELGEVLALAEVPYRWGWEWQSEFGEPSAPEAATPLTQAYPVQSPTWVVLLKDFGAQGAAPKIPAPPNYDSTCFTGAWEGYGPEKFLNYGRLPSDQFMINWPQAGNDYGRGLDRLIQSSQTRQEFLQEAFWYSQGFAHFIQAELGPRYGLAVGNFPACQRSDQVQMPRDLATAFALHPYYRESRRLQGLVTVREQDILPELGNQAAALPIEPTGRSSAIAIGNYPNDHHYPGKTLPLQPKAMKWGGRWTGTPFALPYGALVPQTVTGLLVCDKNISVSHIANGATRLQPVVLSLGQAAGMAAALCIEQHCQPHELPLADLQWALLSDPIAPMALVPILDLKPDHPEWRDWQWYYLEHPDHYPVSRSRLAGATLPKRPAVVSSTTQSASQFVKSFPSSAPSATLPNHLNDLSQPSRYSGIFNYIEKNKYVITLTEGNLVSSQNLMLVTLKSEVADCLETFSDGSFMTVIGYLNRSGKWILVDEVEP